MKGICNVNDLYSDGVFISFSELNQKYDLESKDNLCKFLQIRDSITKGQFTQDKNPVTEFLELPGIAHKAAVFYKIFNRLQKNICKNLRLAWQKDLGCVLNDEIWLRILANTGKYIKEAKGKFTQYRLIHRFYFTPFTLYRMGLLANNLCWKCQEETGTFLHAIWECKCINPFWEKK